MACSAGSVPNVVVGKVGRTVGAGFGVGAGAPAVGRGAAAVGFAAAGSEVALVAETCVACDGAEAVCAVGGSAAAGSAAVGAASGAD